MTKHGWSHTRLYSIWEHVKSRCLNKNDQAYGYYGGRGITVCADWLDFIGFREWAIKNGYKDTLTIDRIDSNKGYYPANCRWATRKEQSNNIRTNKIITYNGKTQTITQWAEELLINPDTLYSRVYRANWSIEKAFTTPTKKISRNGIEYNGERCSLAEWSRKLGINYEMLWARINCLHWPIEKALGVKEVTK